MAGPAPLGEPPAVSRRRPDDGPALDERLEALAAAVAAGDGVVPEPDLRAARALVARAGERLGHGVGHTVVALAGATGSGKSSLFNALVGVDLSTVGVRRPTTSTTHAASWGEDATPLLDWLRVDRRHHVAEAADLDGLVLLDLPDHDSTALEHRREVDRVVAVADMVVWVLDPQKYADGAVHEQYLRPLAHHAGVLIVVLNQVDRLTAEQLDACRRDLAALLADDGLVGVEPLTSSVRLPGGTDQLRSALAERVQARRAAVERLSADVAAVTSGLGRACADGRAGGVGAPDRRRVVDALVEAAGVGTVTNAVAGSHRARAVAATGWPATRWVRRLRPDPLRRLHLGAGTGAVGRTSLPAPDAVSVARVDTALRSLGEVVTADLPLAWADEVRRETGQRAERLPERLDAAVAGTDLGVDRSPRWWAPVGVLQVALIVTAVVGALWLAALAGLAYLQLDDLATPDAGPLPLPTALLLGGIHAGLLVAFLARIASGVGARRRARRARARLEDAVGSVADVEVFAPVADVLERHERFCAALAAGAGPSGGRRRLRSGARAR